MADRREVIKAIGMTAIAGLCGAVPKIVTAQAAQITGGGTV